MAWGDVCDWFDAGHDARGLSVSAPAADAVVKWPALSDTAQQDGDLDVPEHVLAGVLPDERLAPVEHLLQNMLPMWAFWAFPSIICIPVVKLSLV
jgi:hypothetical protein